VSRIAARYLDGTAPEHVIVESRDHIIDQLSHDKLGQLCELSRIISGSRELERVQSAILVGAMALCEADYGSIQLFERDGAGAVHLDRWEGSLEGDVALRCDSLVAPWVAGHGVPLRCDDLSTDPRFAGTSGRMEQPTAVLAVPILHSHELIGVLILGRPTARPFDDEAEKLIIIVAELASSVIFSIRHLRLITEENRRLKGMLAHGGELGGIIGRSPAWHQVCTVLRNVSPSEARVLLLGESGTGKEMCARAVHDLSARRDGPFVAVNCAAMPEQLAESELFGYVRGSFTGATADRHGLFKEADGGTLFLDEVGSASSQVQSSLLRAIQEGEIRPVGSTVPQKVDVRLICATSCNLEEMVEKGTFRKDLYFRINVVALSLPPLRERHEDISLLAHEFLGRYASRNTRQLKGIAPAALVALEGYEWPGNVRELENAIEHAVLFTPPGSEYVPVTALPARVISGTGSDPIPADHDGLGLDRMLSLYEREIVKSALVRCAWNQSETARLLGVSEKRIRNRIKEFDLKSERDHAASGG